MFEKKVIKALLALMSLTLILAACGFPGLAKETAVPVVVQENTATTVPPQPTEVLPSPTAVIQHQQIPSDLPAERSGHAGDYDSSITAENKTSGGGDRFTFERFERPYNASTMDVYFSQLDIVDTFVYQDDTWIYATATLQSADASNALTGKYAAEFDMDINGKGDWLVIVSNPSSTDWNVEGVQVYQDANKDVGGVQPMLTDEGQPGGDGFETLVFGQGTGNDPDGAWARISPNDPNTVEIAVKRSLLGDPKKYLINMWAGTSLLDPALFDISDHFSHEQAGAGDKSLEYFYPIKSVFELDNSCRMAVGFQPTGKEAGLCAESIPEAPSEPQTTGGSACPPPQTLVCSGTVTIVCRCR